MTNLKLYSNKSARTWFYIFILLHLLIWTLVPALIYGNPPNDSLESITWGNLWLLGYNEQPFLAPWVSAAVTDLFGTVGWPIYLVSQFSIIVCFWAVWRLANKMISPWYALIAVVLLEGINYYNIQSAVFDPNILMLPFWALTALCFYNALTDKKLPHWILLGLFSGIAMLVKYESFALIFVLFTFLLTYKEGRAVFKDYKIYCAGLIAILVLSPNIIWLLTHHLDAVNYAVAEMKSNRAQHLPFILRIFYNPFEFTIEQLGNVLPILLLFIPFYQRNDKPFEISAFNKRLLIFLAFGPLIFTLLFSLFTDATLISRWAFPFFSFIGVLLVVWAQPKLSKTRINIFAGIVASITIIMVAGNAYAFIYKPYVTHNAPHSASFPGKKIALTLTKQWHDYYHQPLPYVAGDRHLVNNISSYSPDRPIPYFQWSHFESPWINVANVRKKGGLFVIWLNAPYAHPDPKQIEKRFPQLTHGAIIQYHRLTKAKVPFVKIWVAYLPPQHEH